MSHVFVTGGAGYVGSVLVPKLLARGHRVTVFDLYLYGREPLANLRGAAGLREIVGDLRDGDAVARGIAGCDAVIHLACISNDPSFELDPELGKSINYDCFPQLVAASKAAGVRRFVYASSSSVYGVSDSPEVTETHPLVPLTDYSKFKALCEPILLSAATPSFIPVVARPATVCGYSPRMRFDLSVNILTNHAVNRGKITVFGGSQTRPNIHIEDMADFYLGLLDAPSEKIAGEIFNVGFQNHSILELAHIVRDVTNSHFRQRDVEIETTPTQDLRSYRVDSKKALDVLGFRPRRTIQDAVADLCDAFRIGRFSASADDARYNNVALMKQKTDLVLASASDR
ncbi:MAG: NAD-dependent epimerase/dehydratase family protein [Candidatus Velthaea sp.]